MIGIDKARDYTVKRIEIREVADVEYILQETIDSSLLINDIRGYHVSDKYIVIPQSQRDILLFDRSGKYFGTVNRSGKGQENIAEYPVWLLTLYRKNIMCLIIKKQDKKYHQLSSSVHPCLAVLYDYGVPYRNRLKKLRDKVELSDMSCKEEVLHVLDNTSEWGIIKM